MDFNNKIVWITGASSGIGQALALAFVERGAVVIGSARSAAKLEEIRARSATPERFHVIPLDLADSDTIAPTARKVLAQFGRVDILVNNAGISQRSKTLDTSIETDRKIMEIDYFSAVILTKAILGSMIERGGGYLLCTSSMVGVFGFPLRSAYSAAKHALHGFFESVRTEYHDQGIRVGIIIGGRINTPISLSAVTSDGTPYGKMDEGQKNGISAEKAARRIIKGLERGKHEIRIGGGELLMVTIKRLLPRLHFRLARKVGPT